MQRRSNKRAKKNLKNVADMFCVSSAMFAPPRVRDTVQQIRNLWLCLDQFRDQLGHKLLKGLSKVKPALAAPLSANRDPHHQPNKNQIVVSISEPARRRIFLVQILFWPSLTARIICVKRMNLQAKESLVCGQECLEFTANLS